MEARKGGGCELEARGVSYTIKLPSVRHVLDRVSFTAKPFEILAIVGPSGAGKSTLLQILAGKLSPSPPSSVLLDGSPASPVLLQKTSAFVPQRDSLFPLLTVQETLLFSALLRLRLPAHLASAKVSSLMAELGLSHLAHARVGDDARRGLSGGERRRVSIAVDVVHDPRVLILDEPTSGLDSTAAHQTVVLLKAMAEANGRTVVLSIHQPGSRIVKLFSSLLLLADGQALHHGSVDQLQSRLALSGLHVPLHVNVLDFAMDALHALPPRHRCTLHHLLQRSPAVGSASHGGDRDFPNSSLRETAILTRRYLKNVFRTRELFAGRTVQMLVSGLVLGSIFFKLGEAAGANAAREKVGLFAFVLTFLLGSTTEALPIFLQEREILMKETSCGTYRVSSYVLANSLVFLPFLLILALLFSAPLYWMAGLHCSLSAFLYFLLIIWLVLYTANSVVACFAAMAPNFIVGNSMISGVLGAFFLFSGYFIRKEEIPKYWVFMHYVSLFKYPLEGFLVNEFSDPGKCLEYSHGVCLVNGVEVLKRVGLDVESRWRNVAIMVSFIVLYRFLSYVVLRCRCRCAHRGGIRRALS
ncbi:ABC-2 type transporter family protein [Wolffia australiana]